MPRSARLLSGTDRADRRRRDQRPAVREPRGSRLRRARGRALRVASPLAPRLPAVCPHRLSGAPAVSGRGLRDLVRWRSGVDPSRVPDLVCERAAVGQRRHHRAGCRHRRRLPRRRGRERTNEGARCSARCRACSRGRSIVHPVCRFDAWHTRASRASGHFWAMSMVSHADGNLVEVKCIRRSAAPAERRVRHPRVRRRASLFFRQTLQRINTRDALDRSRMRRPSPTKRAHAMYERRLTQGEHTRRFRITILDLEWLGGA